MSVTFFIENVEAPSVNMSSFNARHILETLGYQSEDLMGSASADDFLGRVLVNQAVTPADSGVSAREVISVDGALGFIDCGREEGYTEVRLIELEELAQMAKRDKLDILWS